MDTLVSSPQSEPRPGPLPRSAHCRLTVPLRVLPPLTLPRAPLVSSFLKSSPPFTGTPAPVSPVAPDPDGQTPCVRFCGPPVSTPVSRREHHPPRLTCGTLVRWSFRRVPPGTGPVLCPQDGRSTSESLVSLWVLVRDQTRESWSVEFGFSGTLVRLHLCPLCLLLCLTTPDTAGFLAETVGGDRRRVQSQSLEFREWVLGPKPLEVLE